MEAMIISLNTDLDILSIARLILTRR